MDARLIAAAALIALPGCATVPSSGFCDVARPYYFAGADETAATPPGVKRFIVEHNTKGGRLCGWKPAR